MAPVRKVPGGTSTCPPPARWQAAMAAAKAAVFLVVPSPFAPNRVTGKVRGGNQGRRTEATIRSEVDLVRHPCPPGEGRITSDRVRGCGRDRKSTRLNSSHMSSSYAVFCLK